MSEPGSTPTVQGLVVEARKILDAVVQLQQAGQQPTLTAVRRSVQGHISLRLSEYVSFLDRYGLLAFRRTDGTVAVTNEGMAAVQGQGLDQLAAHVRAQFPQFPETAAEPAPAPAPAPQVEDVPPMSVPAQAPAAAAPSAEPAPAPAAQEQKVTQEERYERGDAIGTGGLAVVHKAEQRSLGRRIALKQFSDVFQYFTPDQRRVIEQRLVDVIREHAGLTHPHVVRVLDADYTAEFPLLAMEYCPGGSLRDKLKEHDRMPVGLAVQYFLQISEALRYAHGQGVLHRNLKPENVLLDVLGNVLVCDFGITRIVERDDEHIRQVYVGVGTVAYMAPEQYQDARNASVQGDIYSLGIMLYEMLTGKLPGRRSPMPSAYFEDVPHELDDIFDKMTMDFLDVRYASMDEVLADVYDAVDIMRVVDRRAPVLFTGEQREPAADAGSQTSTEDDIFAAVSVPAAASLAAPAVAPAPAEVPSMTVPAPPPEQMEAPAATSPPGLEETMSPVSQVPPPAEAPPAPAGGVASRLDDLAGDLFGDD